MGKRKTATKAAPKKARPKLGLTFDCPFCGHEKTCDVKIDKDRSFGEIKCNICSANYQTNTHKLTQPVDIYAEWIDECDAVNNAADGEGAEGREGREHVPASRRGEDNEEDDGYDRERHDEPDDDWQEGGDNDD